MTEAARQDDAAIDRWMKKLLKCTTENAVVILEPGGRILAWLGAAKLVFGYDADEAVGMPLSRLFTPEDVAAGLDRQERELAISAGRSEDDRWHLRKDGLRFWGSGVMEKITDDDGQVVALAKVLRDRTDVRTQIVALQNRLAAAEDENARRLASLATLAHELRNQVMPLGAMVGIVEKATGHVRATEGMRRQVDVMSRLLDDLSHAASVVASAPELATAPLDVQPVIEHGAAGMQATIAQRRQSLKVTLPSAPITLEADAARLNQILVNLISNASKFTPAEGTIQLSATIEDDMLAMRVEDDGAGIPADVLPRIFDLFTREGGEGAPEGLGLGLSVVKRLTELHGGIVEGRSPGHGQGSIFTVRLPLRQSRLAGAG